MSIAIVKQTPTEKAKPRLTKVLDLEKKRIEQLSASPVDRVAEEVSRRVAGIIDRVFIGEDGTRRVQTRELAIMLGMSQVHLSQHNLRKEETDYTETQMDGTVLTIRGYRGIRGRREFNFEDAVALVTLVLREKERTIEFVEMAKVLGVSKAWIQKQFGKGKRIENGEELEIMIKGKKKKVILYYSKSSRECENKRYMAREDFEFFSLWAKTKYQKPTWDRVNSATIPEGWMSTGQAAKAIGYRASDQINQRVKAGTIAGKKLPDGRIIVSVEEVERVKRERERLTATESSRRVGEVLKSIGKDVGWFDARTEGPEGKKVLVILDVYGKEQRFETHLDFDRALWFSGKDSERLEKVVGEKDRELITLEQLAERISRSIPIIYTLINPETRSFEYKLPDGTVSEVSGIKEGGVNYFYKSELEAALELEQGLLRSMRFLDEIAEAIGCEHQRSGLWILERAGKVFRFTLNGKEYEIEVKNGKYKKTYLLDWELEIFAKYHGIRTRRTHVYLFSGKAVKGLTREGAKKRLEQILDRENRRLILYRDNTAVISVPIDELDGKFYLRNEHIPLVEFYLKLTSRFEDSRRTALETIMAEEVGEEDPRLLLLARLTPFEKRDHLREQREEFINREGIAERISRRMHSPFVEYIVDLRISNPKAYETLELDLLGRFVVVSYEYRIAVPVRTNSSRVIVDVEDTELLKLYEDLFHPQNGESYSSAQLFIDRINGNLNDRSRAGLWVIRDFIMRHSFREMDEGCGATLCKSLDDARFGSVWGRSYDSLGKYSVDSYTRNYRKGKPITEGLMD
ncbi:MAG: hypothetical protein PHU63_01865 [Candidatus ainarchaeum sp.]|nr:hypothetical protein [Candidatus ainarchaeum sp.]